MVLYFDGLFISIGPRMRDGKREGYDMLVAKGTEAQRVKVTDEVYSNCAVNSLTFGQRIYCAVKVNCFKDRIYLSADDVQRVEEG